MIQGTVSFELTCLPCQPSSSPHPSLSSTTIISKALHALPLGLTFAELTSGRTCVCRLAPHTLIACTKAAIHLCHLPRACPTLPPTLCAHRTPLPSIAQPR